MKERAGCQAGQAHGRASLGQDLFGTEAKVEVPDQTKGVRQELGVPGWVPRCQG